MSTTDKTADKLVQSIRKTKSATSAPDSKAPAVAAVSTTPPKSAAKNPASAATTSQSTSSAQTTTKKEESVRSFQFGQRVWPD